MVCQNVRSGWAGARNSGSPSVCLGPRTNKVQDVSYLANTIALEFLKVKFTFILQWWGSGEVWFTTGTV